MALRLRRFSFCAAWLVLTIAVQVAPTWGQLFSGGRSAPPPASQGNSQGTTNVPPNPNGKTEREPIWVVAGERGDGHFRRILELPNVEHAHLEIEASEPCEIYLNGRRIATTTTPGRREKIDAISAVRPGTNILAIRASNRTRTEPYLTAAFYFKPVNQKWRIVVSDETWKGANTAPQGWQLARFDDSSWQPALSLTAAPLPAPPQPRTSVQINEEMLQTKTIGPKQQGTSPTFATLADYDSKTELPPPERFTTRTGFQVAEVFEGSEIGSIIAISFNEFGHLIASQEGGPLLLLYDSDKDGEYDKSRVYCELVENVQGILALNGEVYVTGDGEKGSGLYRLIDSDRNGELERAELLVQFQGTPGEHGPHQIVFGPDGAIYVVIGNHSTLSGEWPENSTYPKPYEGDLVQPRFEDPGGHADGVLAPGGTVVRYELTTQSAEIVAGGIRNAYDLAFHPNGSLYTFDSDMEADIGSVWHRNTGLFRVSEGAEFGWRSGWANWPDYYLDRLPPLASAGRSSPTGMVFYNHHIYPTKYHRSLFVADWSEGRILSCNLDNDLAARPKLEEFVVGTPMNVTDLDVGPDGYLYFSTGGRGTEGGIYRVEWTGEVPQSVTELGTGITRAIRQPQLNSAYGRQAAALVKKELGSEWGELVAGVAYSTDNPAKYRLQALDLMQLLGPVPTPEMLIELSNSTSEVVRAKCVRMLGMHSEPEVAERLVALLDDPSQAVRQAVCESMIRIGVICDPTALMKSLQSDHREERFLARRLLALIPEKEWKSQFLSSSSNRLAINSALVLATTSKNKTNAELVLDSLKRVTDGFVSDADFVDLLRVVQVTLHSNKVDGAVTHQWKGLVENEFPAGNATINAELIRLATYLQCDVVPAALEYLEADAPMPEKVLIAMHLPMLKHQWASRERMAFLQFLESAQKVNGGGSYQLYVMRTAHAMAEFLTESESLKILTLGEEFPNAALAALFKLPEELPPEAVESLIQLDQKIDQGGLEEDVYKRLKTGITAILASQENEAAGEYLRERWRKSPDRRSTIATALAQRPDEKSWDYLVRSLGYLDLFAVPDVASALMEIDLATDDPEAIRQAIIQGCKLVDAGQSPKPITDLLHFWTGERLRSENESGVSPMSPWQRWFEVRFPESPPAVLASATDNPRWSLEFLEKFFEGEQGKFGSLDQGEMLFAKAQCAACHKMNGKGNGFGPDLSSIAKRFTKTEFLESVLFPSHVISDQYASKRVLTVHGDSYTGIVVKSPSGLTVRVNEEKEVKLDQHEIEEILPSKISTMPAGLFDKLTPAEIRDLLCFFGYIPQQNIAEEKTGTVRR